jgi:hypothetical protein
VDLFDPRDWRFVRSISKTLCRLHLIVLVDLIMFTHANRFANYSHMLVFPSSILPPTSPTQTISRSQYFDISVSCMLRCHQWRYRYVYARQRGARHHAAVPHGWRHILVLPMHVNERPIEWQPGWAEACSAVCKQARHSQKEAGSRHPGRQSRKYPHVRSGAVDFLQLCRVHLGCSSKLAPPITDSACGYGATISAAGCIVSCFDNIRTWYAVVACRPGGCMSLAGHSQVCLGGAKGYLTRGIFLAVAPSSDCGPCC